MVLVSMACMVVATFAWLEAATIAAFQGAQTKAASAGSGSGPGAATGKRKIGGDLQGEPIFRLPGPAAALAPDLKGRGNCGLPMPRRRSDRGSDSSGAETNALPSSLLDSLTSPVSDLAARRDTDRASPWNPQRPADVLHRVRRVAVERHGVPLLLVVEVTGPAAPPPRAAPRRGRRGSAPG